MSSFNAEFKEILNESHVTVNSCGSKVEWLLESGCSDYVINDDRYFYESIEFKENINVKVGNGCSLKATIVKNIRHKFNVYGQNNNLFGK